MNHPFFHLLWKSYRSQRVIWLVILGWMLLMQLLATANTGLENPSTIALMITALVAPCFLCISTLLIFVVEEEHGTVSWLRMLPMKWWHQLGAGLLCTIGLTTVLVAVGFVTAFVGNVLYERQFDPRDIKYLWLTFCIILLPVWLVGLVASVVFRRVLFVLPIIAFSGIANAIIAANMWPKMSTGILTSIVAIFALPFLVRRWQLGRPWALPKSWFKSRFFDQAPTSGFHRRFSIRTGLLQQIIKADGVTQRSTLALYWMELIQAIPFAVFMLCVGLGTVIYDHSSTFPLCLATIWLYLFTLESGLRTFRHDQQKQHGLFLTHRGVSPLKVSIIKNMTWLPLLLLVSLTVIWFDQFVSFSHGTRQSHSIYGIHGLMTLLADPIVQVFSDRSMLLINGSATSELHALAAVVTTGYFVAQLCSAWLRSPLIAGFASMMFFVIGLIWITNSQLQDVPFTYSTWPIAIFCAVAVAFTGRSWMDRRHDRRTWIKRTIVACLLPVCLFHGYNHYRQTQIGSGFFSLAHKMRQSSMASPNDYHDKLLDTNQPTLTENPTTDSLWLELLIQDTEIPSRSCSQIISNIQSVSNWNQCLLPIEARTSWQASIAPTLQKATITEVSELVRNKKTKEAFQLLLKSMKLTEYLAKQTTDWAELERCMSCLRGLHQHIHWCASSDQVTISDLRSAVALSSVPFNYFNSASSMIRNRNAAFHQLTQPDSDLTKQFAELPEVTLPGRQNWPMNYRNLWPKDKARHQSLLAIANLSGLWWIWDPQRFESRFFRLSNNQFRRWADTTPSMGFDLDPALVGYAPDRASIDPIASIHATINIHIVTWWILKAQIYRREHGRMPTEAELRLWLKKKGDIDPIGWFSDWPQLKQLAIHLQGFGVTTVSRFHNQQVELQGQQPSIGSTANQFTSLRKDATGQKLTIIPLNKDRIIYLERNASIPPQLPVSGELAELIRNSPSEQSGRKGTENTGQAEADE